MNEKEYNALILKNSFKRAFSPPKELKKIFSNSFNIFILLVIVYVFFGIEESYKTGLPYAVSFALLLLRTFWSFYDHLLFKQPYSLYIQSLKQYSIQENIIKADERLNKVTRELIFLIADALELGLSGNLLAQDKRDLWHSQLADFFKEYIKTNRHWEFEPLLENFAPDGGMTEKANKLINILRNMHSGAGAGLYLKSLE